MARGMPATGARRAKSDEREAIRQDCLRGFMYGHKSLGVIDAGRGVCQGITGRRWSSTNVRERGQAMMQLAMMQLRLRVQNYYIRVRVAMSA